MLYLHFPCRLPFSCSTRRTCRATAASTLTGSSLSEQRHWRTISKEVFKFCSFLNFSSQKCFNTHAACNRKKKTITEAPFLLNWFTQKKWNGLFFNNLEIHAYSSSQETMFTVEFWENVCCQQHFCLVFVYLSLQSNSRLVRNEWIL